MAELALAVGALSAAGLLGFGLRADDPLASPLTPAAGVAIGLLWVRGLRLWPAAAAGVGVAELLLGSPAPIAVLDGLATAVEVTAGAALLALVVDRGRPFGRVREVVWFVGLAVVAAPLLGAVPATAGRWLAGDPGVIRDWWLGDGVGILIAAPLVIVWSTPLPHADRRTLLGYAGLAAATAALAAIVFGDDANRVTELYLLLPLAVGAALLGRRHAAVAATAAVTAIGVAATFAGHGPVATGNVLDGLATLDGFLVTFALGGLVLASVETGRRLAEARSLRLHDQLRAAQQAEAIGQLAGGAAHDFTNLLLAVRGYGELARERIRRGDAGAEEHLDELLHVTDRAADMSRGLLTLGRPAPGPPTAVDLSDVVRDAARILPPLVGGRVDIRACVPDEPVVVEAHRSQLERVVINLAVNAGDAMPDGGPLEIAVGSSVDATTGEPEAVLTVTDAGLGMDTGTSARIFDPYFTTKGDAGTGLGLATVQRIVGQLGGRVAVRSHPGQGSSFSVHLPEAA
jgi:signal transduction histidine kinase